MEQRLNYSRLAPEATRVEALGEPTGVVVIIATLPI
jgi:hypothetical protein